ncbi:hypothetical protein IWZ01DRAFT_491738 [Phyllosticta capitalensis]
MPTVARLSREPTARWKTYVRSGSSASPTVWALTRSLDTFITTTQHNPSTPTSTSVAVVRREQSSQETGHSSRTGIVVAVLVSVLGVFLVIALPLWFCRQPRHPPNEGSKSKSPSTSLPPSPVPVPPPAPPPTHNPGAAAHPASGDNQQFPPPPPPPTHNSGAAAHPASGDNQQFPPPPPPPIYNPGAGAYPASGENQQFPPPPPPPIYIPGADTYPAGGGNAPVPPFGVTHVPVPPEIDPIIEAILEGEAIFNGKGFKPVTSKRNFRRIKPDERPHGRREIEDKSKPGYFLRPARPERRERRRRQPKGNLGGDGEHDDIDPEVKAFVDKLRQRTGKGNVTIERGEFRRPKRRHTAIM